MKLLVIEDDVRIAGSLKAGLSDEGYAVDVEHDGMAGLAAATGDEYDAIILDGMLPELDGMEVLRQLRNSGNTTQVLMLTARGTQSDIVKGLDGGADDYLVKPFSFDELLARLRALLRRPTAALGEVLKADDLELDPAQRVVTRAGQAIDLSAKEFAILEYLLRNRGQIVGKDKLIQHVWDFDADILPNTVEVFVAYLRRKIDKPFRKAKPLIKTVRGAGYTIRGSDD